MGEKGAHARGKARQAWQNRSPGLPSSYPSGSAAGWEHRSFRPACYCSSLSLHLDQVVLGARLMSVQLPSCEVSRPPQTSPGELWQLSLLCKQLPRVGKHHPNIHWSWSVQLRQGCYISSGQLVPPSQQRAGGAGPLGRIRNPPQLTSTDHCTAKCWRHRALRKDEAVIMYHPCDARLEWPW